MDEQWNHTLKAGQTSTTMMLPRRSEAVSASPGRQRSEDGVSLIRSRLIENSLAKAHNASDPLVVWLRG